MESKIKELKIKMLKETAKKKAIRKEIARIMTKENAEGKKK